MDTPKSSGTLPSTAATSAAAATHHSSSRPSSAATCSDAGSCAQVLSRLACLNSPANSLVLPIRLAATRKASSSERPAP